MFVSSTVNSDILQYYLSILKYALAIRKNVNAENTVLILDSASIHKSKTTFERLKDLQMDAYFIPPYTPSLAPVELFFKQIKSMFKVQQSSKLIKLDRNAEGLELCKIMLQLEGAPIKTSWKEFIKNAFSILKYA